MIQWR